MRRFLRHRVCLLAIVLALGSCGSDNEPTAYYVRAVHGMKDAPILRMSLTGIPLVAALDYRQVSALLPPVTRDSQAPLLEVFGQVPGDESISILEREIPFRGNREYTLVLAGTVAEPSLVVAQVERRTKPVTGAYLQVTHAAVALGPLDVFVTGPEDELAGAVPFVTLSSGRFSDSLPIVQGDTRIRVTPSVLTGSLPISWSKDE